MMRSTDYFCLYWTDEDGNHVMRGYAEDLAPWVEQFEQDETKTKVRVKVFK